MRVNAYVGTFGRYVRALTAGSAQCVDDRVLDLQRAEMRVGDGRMPPAELAGQRRAGTEVQRPVDLANPRVELLRVVRLELRNLEKYAVRGARPQAGTVGAFKVAAKGHTARALAHLKRAQRGELARQEIGQATRRAGDEIERCSAHGIRGRTAITRTGLSTWSS